MKKGVRVSESTYIPEDKSDQGYKLNHSLLNLEHRADYKYHSKPVTTQRRLQLQYLF